MRVHARSVLCVVWLCAGCGDTQAAGPARSTPTTDAGLDASLDSPASDASVDAASDVDAGLADAGLWPDASTSEPDSGSVRPQPSTDLTYHADMLPLFETHCLPCHDAGGSGPFSIRQYSIVYLSRYAIRGATGTREMPPCGSAPIEECGLSDEEIARIADWVNGGAPEGQAD